MFRKSNQLCKPKNRFTDTHNSMWLFYCKLAVRLIPKLTCRQVTLYQIGARNSDVGSQISKTRQASFLHRAGGFWRQVSSRYGKSLWSQRSELYFFLVGTQHNLLIMISQLDTAEINQLLQRDTNPGRPTLANQRSEPIRRGPIMIMTTRPARATDTCSPEVGNCRGGNWPATS